MPTNRKGNRRSQINGYSAAAISANGQQTTSKRHQSRNVTILILSEASSRDTGFRTFRFQSRHLRSNDGAEEDIVRARPSALQWNEFYRDATLRCERPDRFPRLHICAMRRHG